MTYTGRFNSDSDTSSYMDSDDIMYTTEQADIIYSQNDNLNGYELPLGPGTCFFTSPYT